jgi:hypothetical protein
MTIKASKLGPGHLTFGSAGTTSEFGSQCTKVELNPKFDDGDIVTVLSGEELAEDDGESYELTGEFYQDYSMAGLLTWCKTNSGTVMPFVFVPDDESALSVTGSCKIRAVKIGGDVKKRNTTEFTFPGVGDYELVDHIAP